MKRLSLRTWILFGFLVVRPYSATLALAKEKEPFAEEIARIEKRAELIAGYERASILSSDYLMGRQVDTNGVETWVALFEERMWVVYYGKLSKKEKQFKSVYVVAIPHGKSKEVTMASPRKTSKDLLTFARAIKIAANEITEPQVPRYNPSVFREIDGTITVYFLPGNTQEGIVLIGGEYKVSVSSDGKRVLNSRKVHNSILRMQEHPADPDDKPAGGYHTHVLGDLPEETEVAVLRLHPTLAPHIIVGEKWTFGVDKEGKVFLMGKSKDVFESSKEE